MTLAGGLTNSGTLNVDNSFGNEVGGSIVNLGGALNNDSGTLNIGNAGLGASTKVTATGLSNTGGTINITGNTTPGTTDQGRVWRWPPRRRRPRPATFLWRATRSCSSPGRAASRRSARGTTLALDGAQARGGAEQPPGQHSALTGLSSNAGALTLLNGASVTTIGSA